MGRIGDTRVLAAVSGLALVALPGGIRIAHAAVVPVMTPPVVVGTAFVPVRAGHATDAHFAAANTSRDGRLTWDQARQADWPQVANHFAEIDTAGRGWVTLAQIHAFDRARHRRRAGPG